MSQTSTTAASSSGSRFQAIFEAAIKDYQKQTKKGLLDHPLASQLQSCNSTTAIISILQDQVREFDKSHSGDERLTKWLGPTVNVINAFSATISGGVSLVFSPASVIFTGIGVFAAQGVAASRDVLAELFDRIGYFFTRLESYTEVAPTTGMTDIITQILVEVLRIFGIATKELKRGSATKYLRKLAGMTDLEDALKKLDRLTQEEAHMALAEVRRMTHIIRDEVKVVDRKLGSVQGKVDDIGDKVEGVGDKVEEVGGRVVDVGDRVEDVGDNVKIISDQVELIGDEVEVIDDRLDAIGDNVKDVGDKVDDIGEEVRGVDEKVQAIIDESKQAILAAKETRMIIQQTATGIDEIKWNQWNQLLRSWLSPADPSTNHNIARKAQHEGTAVWLFQGKIVIEWKSTGSLLWIYGKPGSGKSVICSSVIQDIMAVCETGSAIMAYFYFDFRDLNKQTCHDLLRSLVFQLSTYSGPCCDILHRIYETHKGGTQQPSDDTLKGCLKEMLRLLAHGPVFIVLDAIDECPESPGFPPPRYEVLQLVKELVDLRLRGLSICATSRPEVDIRAVFQHLASRSVSLHDESGQKEDISDYVRTVVNSSPSSDGYSASWRRCNIVPTKLRQFINELPETLDETYDRILKGINTAQKDDAHRLLQCLTVASRPLRVKELAELLAFDFEASSSGGTPKLREDWRWDDEEEAVLSTCSSLIAIVRGDDSPVVQFSHFSVKEYLTSSRLAQSPHRDVSRFHIDLESAHTIMAQACLAKLLHLDENTEDTDAEWSPLVEYAAEHWVDHAQFDDVSSRVRDGMNDLFDSSKPHFAGWLQVHDIDEDWPYFLPEVSDSAASPLYYAAFCGFYDLTERLITEHPEQVNAAGGRTSAPLPAALSRGHFHTADLLYRHGADVDVQDYYEDNLLHAASSSGQVDIMRWLLDHGTDPNACGYNLWAPLHYAARDMRLDAVHVLLTYNADVNSQTDDCRTPLYVVFSDNFFSERKVVDMVRRLLEHGADPNVPHQDKSTPLHQASSHGWLEVARLLLSYGAKVDDKDGKDRTPYQVAASKGHDEITKLLFEHGAVFQT
ncbi:hypothetical protein EI94DRAFT_1832014 [Lactarius quietus]|nr:hypothetical protein EI94DRAFT_1832014 [Lactarius quietus]